MINIGRREMVLDQVITGVAGVTGVTGKTKQIKAQIAQTGVGVSLLSRLSIL